VTIGSPVRPGQQIGIIEAMKLMIPVEADRHGRIANILKANNEPVEYGEPLFELAAGEGAEADV
jgi:acetyl-CoA carboxylase biotin carboxyl carrier protein